MKKILMIMAAVLAGGIIMAGSFEIGADSKFISYSGRVDFTDPKAPRFDWPGIQIGISFENSAKCSAVLIDEGRNDFNVIIDGKQTGILSAEKGEKEYLLASGLTLKKHTVLLTKRTEGYDGITVFKGFALDTDAKPAAAKKKSRKKIEFIGDSLTVGYGVEGKSIQCDSERKYKNNYLAFSSVAARQLDADYNIVAISGRGVIRNYGEKTAVSAEPLPLFYDRTLMNDEKVKWDFRYFVPDIVVINLGTNDFSTEPKPENDVFISNYVKLIERVRAAYPGAEVFICVGPTQSEPFFKCMDELFGKLKDDKIHRVAMKPLTEADWACDYHPNIKAAARMAGELAAEIKKVRD